MEHVRGYLLLFPVLGILILTVVLDICEEFFSIRSIQAGRQDVLPYCSRHVIRTKIRED